MDKLTETAKEEKMASGEGGFFSRIRSVFFQKGAVGASDKRFLVIDIAIFAISLFFARCHVIFGARPLAIAFIAVLPSGVWQAMFGAVIGSLTLGKSGIIYAMVSIIVAFLRVIISGGDKRRDDGPGSLFGENLLLRMSSSIIAGFVAAVYEVLLSGISQTSVLFGASMILIPPALTFIFSGIFCLRQGFCELVWGEGNVFSLKDKEDKEKYNLIFFQTSVLIFLFFLSLSLKELTLLGISFSYIFVNLALLVVAKRFGALRALAVGFASSLGTSGIFSVSFALAGLGAGALFGFGLGYGLIGGGALAIGWGVYSSGLTGLLTVMPEYVIAAAIAAPLLKKIAPERSNSEAVAVSESAKDMVGTMALSYKNRYSGHLDGAEVALSSLASVIREFSCSRLGLSKEEYKNLVLDIAEAKCKSCQGQALCSEENIRPAYKNADSLADILFFKRRVTEADVNTDTEFCAQAKIIADRINSAAARKEKESFLLRQSDSTAEEYELISKLINEARLADDGERALDNILTKKAEEAFCRSGFADGVIKVFGERKKHFIMAGEDEEGEKITSSELKASLEEATGLKLAPPEYFRRGKMTLMECDIRRSYKVECATASLAGGSDEISGDTVTAFETASDYFYSLISDGMGRGEAAKSTSAFVADFLKRILDFGASKDTVLHMLNHIIRKRTDECSATVDLFEVDLLLGEATFLKSGAAPSYVKRGASIFRIRSQTAPIGLLRTIDSEKIRVEIKEGDYVIMLSDGVCPTAEESPWLLELLSRQNKGSLKEYADYILTEAKKNSASSDDMSVVVLKIGKTA